MPCQILVAYQCAVQAGEIIGIFDGDHIFGRYETLARWGSRSTWPRNFTVVRVADKTRAELLYLLDRIRTDTPEEVAQYHFTVPKITDPEYAPLNDNGEIRCGWAVALSYLRERS
jgi:hypothetical protein